MWTYLFLFPYFKHKKAIGKQNPMALVQKLCFHFINIIGAKKGRARSPPFLPNYSKVVIEIFSPFSFPYAVAKNGHTTPVSSYSMKNCTANIQVFHPLPAHKNSLIHLYTPPFIVLLLF